MGRASSGRATAAPTTTAAKVTTAAIAPALLAVILRFSKDHSAAWSRAGIAAGI